MEHRMEISWGCKIELPYATAIQLVGVYPEKMTSLYQRDTSSLMFVTALFTKAKITFCDHRHVNGWRECGKCIQQHII